MEEAGPFTLSQAHIEVNEHDNEPGFPVSNTYLPIDQQIKPHHQDFHLSCLSPSPFLLCPSPVPYLVDGRSTRVLTQPFHPAALVTLETLHAFQANRGPMPLWRDSRAVSW